jgi:mono/diheme cytochrome c family protein
VVITPAILATLFFLLPFFDRSLERRPWRRPIPVLAVAVVVAGTIFLGVKSHLDDQHDSPIAAQLALQAKQEEAYTAAPFQPYIESPGGSGPLALPIGPVNPLVSRGRGIFQAHGCSGCHGEVGLGGRVAPSLQGVTTKYPEPQLNALLHHPNAAMRAGGMPAVNISAGEMSALLAYLGEIGTSAANVQASSGQSQASAAMKEAVTPATRSVGPSDRTQAAPSATLSNAAIAGQQLYQQRGCFACHGQSGQGGRAHALAPLIMHESDARLAELLENPSAKMKAGGMPPVFGTPDQRRDLIAYLRTLPLPSHPQSQQPVGKIPTRTRSVPPPDMAPAPVTASAQPLAVPEMPITAPSSSAAPTSAAVTEPSPGRSLFLSQGCPACHGSTAGGTRFAPSLIGVAKKFPGNKLPYLLRHPTSKMRDGGMPTVAVNDMQMRQLVDYLSGLAGAPALPPVRQAASGARAAPTHPSSTPAIVAQVSPPRVAPSHPISPLAMHGQEIFQRMSCESCHGVGGLTGTVAAPPLAGTASLLPADVLDHLLRHHSTRMQQGGMPPTNLKPPDMKALVAYIRAMPASSNRQ